MLKNEALLKFSYLSVNRVTKPYQWSLFLYQLNL
ncbi:hypothetical protein MTsPCn9_33960 [Croceitalea sp. MTPC9]|nr:hypothetical protein MTsPCn6_18070 [Croceitalea sp. MTPC6]GMN18456.1 hypothetical protein MTsPCn9_33960 [Croceitalea sp. MTPC9]